MNWSYGNPKTYKELWPNFLFVQLCSRRFAQRREASLSETTLKSHTTLDSRRCCSDEGEILDLHSAKGGSLSEPLAGSLAQRETSENTPGATVSLSFPCCWLAQRNSCFRSAKLLRSVKLQKPATFSYITAWTSGSNHPKIHPHLRWSCVFDTYHSMLQKAHKHLQNTQKHLNTTTNHKNHKQYNTNKNNYKVMDFTTKHDIYNGKWYQNRR